jgi:hypothetical protein
MKQVIQKVRQGRPIFGPALLRLWTTCFSTIYLFGVVVVVVVSLCGGGAGVVVVVGCVLG